MVVKPVRSKGWLGGVCWDLMEFRSRLFGLNVRESDGLGPFFSFRDDELVQVDRRYSQGRGAEVSEAHDDLRIREPHIDFTIELINDLRGRIFRSPDGDPRAGLKTRQELAKRRNIWQCGRT